MAKTPIDPEMVKRTSVPATPEQLAATAESRRSAALQAVQQQEAQRASRAQAAEQQKRAGWVAEAQAQAKAAMQPRQPSVPPLSRDWKPEQKPLSIPEVGPPSPAQSQPMASQSGPTRETRSERLARQGRDADITFREGKFLGMTPPNWVTNRPPSMDPNRSATEQMIQYLSKQQGMGGGQFGAAPQGMPPQPGLVPQGAPSPNRPPAPMGLGDMSQQGQQMPMGLGEGGRALPFNFDPQAMEQSYQATQPAMGPRGAEYDAARESLRKAAANVAADPRFSQEQRSAAFERIRSKMGELEANFAEGQDLMQSPTGFDAPPPEEFGLLQPGGLQPIGGGQLRNPDTGDILETVRGPNGEVLPVNLRQPEIDALPSGTRYLDQSGKVQVAGEAGGRRAAGGAAAGGATRGGAQPTMPGTFATQEEAFAAYEKWAAKKDPGTTRGEQQIISQVLASIPDEELRTSLQGQIAGDPTRAAEILQQHTQIPLAEEFENARLKEFSTEQKARGERAQRLGREMGLTPPEETPPAVDPNRYFVETGTRGTTVIKRRGSNVAIPGIFDENGELRAAPQTAQQLMEIEPGTEFVNVRPSSGGKEFRILPFADERVNVGDFALSNEQRRKFANETAQIAPRRPEEWQAFEKALSQFAAVNEPWDPDNNPAQAQLERSVHAFYRELGPAGKAAMTMHVAHALGHVVDSRGAFKSTGWAAKKMAPREPAPQKADATRQTLNQMIPAMARLMEDESLMTRFRRGITGGLRAGAVGAVGAAGGAGLVVGTGLAASATGPETNKSKRERQAFEIVKTLASSLEEQFPDIERGSPEFKKKAGEAISALIESNRDSLPAGTSTETLKAMQQRLMEGFGIQPEAAPAAPEPFRPKNREDMVKGFADAWRQQRGMASPPSRPAPAQPPQQRGTASPTSRPAPAQPPRAEAEPAKPQAPSEPTVSDRLEQFYKTQEAQREETKRQRGVTERREQFVEDEKRSVREDNLRARREWEARREAERRAPDIEQRRLYDEAIGQQRAEEERRQQFRSQVASERAQFESGRATERAAPDVRQGAIREQRLVMQNMEAELAKYERYINAVGRENVGAADFARARQLKREIERKRKEIEEMGRYREPSR